MHVRMAVKQNLEIDVLYINGKREGRVLPADTFPMRLRGLIGRSFSDGFDALALIPCRQIHTFMMKYPIDVIYADRYGYVLDTAENVLPGQYLKPVQKARTVLELPAGRIAKLGVTAGDRIGIIHEA